MKQDAIVDMDLLGRLSGLSMKVSGAVEGQINGRHRSPHHGASVEFAQHREYAPGDEIRHIDWKSYGRSDRFYIKEYEDETNLNTVLVVDSSASMNFAYGEHPTKLTYASRLAVALSWVLIRQGDAVGLVTHNDSVRDFIPPRSAPDHFWRVVSSLEKLKAEGQTDLTHVLLYLAGLRVKRCHFILLSDCLEFQSKFMAIARQLKRRRHKVTVLQILDGAEIDFPFDELTIFEGMEALDEIQVDPRAMKETYLSEFTEWRDTLRRTLQDGQVDYVEVRTDRALEDYVFPMLDGGPR